jgi:hypothetical protein
LLEVIEAIRQQNYIRLNESTLRRPKLRITSLPLAALKMLLSNFANSSK